MPRVRLLHFVPIELEANDIRSSVARRFISDDVKKLAPASILPVRLWVVKKLSDLEMSELRRIKDSTVLPLNLAVKTL
jgi:hypothetical protein